MSIEKEIINQLEEDQQLSQDKFKQLLLFNNEDAINYLHERARFVHHAVYGNTVYIRGLIELTNYCKNDCYYCGIRRSNQSADRYRLTKEQILNCCEIGYALGFRTFVLQGGEDGYFTDDRIVDMILSIKKLYPDCALTLSIGEKSFDRYKAYFDAGADRYLLRHETANCNHYALLHPQELSLENRKRCLWDLKKIGFQVGSGFMVGSPYQSLDNIVEDLLFIKELDPQMVGIGPFIPHKDTPFAREPAGTLEQTLRLISIIRLMLPNVLLPSTTSLGTIHPLGREKGILAGANVIMPNLSPIDVRGKYLLYDNKICTGEETAEGYRDLEMRMDKLGYKVVVSRGDYRK